MDSIIKKIEKQTMLNDYLTPAIIREKDVKLGLRNPDGTGVVAGITTKGRVDGYQKILKDPVKRTYEVRPVPGKLFYCGYDVEDIVAAVEKQKRFGFEEVAYLLLAGELPKQADLRKFIKELGKRRALSKVERQIIMSEVQNDNQMFALHSVISHLNRCDEEADSTAIDVVCRQSINLIAKFPTIVAANYNVLRYSKGFDLRIIRPRQELSTAENFLYLLHGDVPDPEEAHLFDIALILHAEHGGGNNSTFSVRSVSSSGANTYMAIAAGIASLSGHLHGGANESVKLMMKELKKSVRDWESDREIKAYLHKIIEGKVGDMSGKIYGFGHAVYTISDPRAIILREYARKLSVKKEMHDEFLLYEKVEKLATEMLNGRGMKIMSANVDYYSGFIYEMLGIPRELYTPIFAMARVVGWCAHRIEQIMQGKIIRPAYIQVSSDVKQYQNLRDRK
ncbi:MAG TPA: citrate synthase [Spirochaetota bacterium]|nr:citrate synthase [Spirochaetota bacterium]HPG49394.1 citrate synthase [Spirochaetota bacterium]HPN14364.1 citrate synthase [Spirochaetota bacterium]